MKHPMKLESDSRVAVMGGGPAGSFFSYFLLDLAKRLGTAVHVDIYEPRDFTLPGPAGCNMCGGIVSESLVQLLAAEGISLPHAVVERGIDSYTLHMPEGNVHIDTPLHERRIAAVHRGAGPRGMEGSRWQSFDNYLLELAKHKGAHVLRVRVDEVTLNNGRPQVASRGNPSLPYDLLVVATGVNCSTARLFSKLELDYRPPQTSKAFICELHLGQERIAQSLGSSMHVFLLPLPRLEFAALIPKGDYVTLCLLGKDIDDALVQLFLDASEVKRCLPPDWEMPRELCHCSPRINTRAARAPFADRVVFIGDAGATRLYKDGIGAAYRTAKAAALTALFEGVSASDFQRRYAPVCRQIEFDNRIGKLMFFVTGLQRAIPSSRTGILRMVAREQRQSQGPRRMSDIMWDMFTGSSSYRAIFFRTLHPFFLPRLICEVLAGIISPFHTGDAEPSPLEVASLGRVYQDGEIIIQEGEFGDCMYVVQEGQVEVLQGRPGAQVRLTVQGKGAIFGEIALMQGEIRSATVRAMGPARVLTVDKATFLRRIHEDPSIAYRMMVNMSQRIRNLSDEVVSLKTADVANGNQKRPFRPSDPVADIGIMSPNSAKGAPTYEAEGE